MGNDQQGYSILTVNGGSSSIKLSVFEKKDGLQLFLSGKIERIGLKDASFRIRQGEVSSDIDMDVSSFEKAIRSLMEWLHGQSWFADVKVVGHRIVHGMRRTASMKVTEELLKELEGRKP